MDTRVQKRKIRGKYTNYYINMPKHIIKKALWLKKRKIVDVSIDLAGHVVIKPR